MQFKQSMVKLMYQFSRLVPISDYYQFHKCSVNITSNHVGRFFRKVQIPKLKITIKCWPFLKPFKKGSSVIAAIPKNKPLIQ